jgi:hypothetical protein
MGVRMIGRSRTSKTYVSNDVLFTPPEIFELLAIEFDLDVCAPTGGLDWIPAKKSIDETEDGLATEWKGKVWMNPPYSNVTPWMDKWLKHKNGFCLVPFSAAKWSVKLWDSEATGVLMDQTTIKFITPDLTRQAIFMPVGLWAIGETNITALKMSNLGRVR